MRIQPGLVSVTFRKLSPEEVIAVAIDAGLTSIEWGGDIHVPHGDLTRAKEVAAMTAAAGLSVSAYGSYYRAGGPAGEGPTFKQVLDSAMALDAPVIRVWAGKKGSADATPEDRKRVVRNLRTIAETAYGKCRVAMEFHGNTLTDTLASTLQLFDEVKHENLYTYWQPLGGRSHEDHLNELVQIRSRLLNLHVYHWSEGTRLPLAEGAERWREFLRAAVEQPACAVASLEFVRNDDPAVLKEDAATLRALLGELT